MSKALLPRKNTTHDKTITVTCPEHVSGSSLSRVKHKVACRPDQRGSHAKAEPPLDTVTAHHVYDDFIKPVSFFETHASQN